ncbi:MAG: hypothetical protein KIT56_08250 [Gammaproteobacteria bacterium]|nr:hypothetical protein [Gammaproteobacteria bacterium]MCW5583850.1 hypothetical protein [Gammaproteobacteria bacterium]
MKRQDEDKISQIMNNAEKVREIIQSGINAALLKHKQVGNPICEWKNDRVVWIEPENIPVEKDKSVCRNILALA